MDLRNALRATVDAFLPSRVFWQGKVLPTMLQWIIYTQDGEELARVEANDARLAFLFWRNSEPTFVQDIHATAEPDGTCQVMYQGETFVLRRGAPQ